MWIAFRVSWSGKHDAVAPPLHRQAHHLDIGGILGANTRYLVGGWIAARYGTSFPYATMVINVSGSFIIGFFLVLISERFIVHPNWRLFFAIGFLGAYTTFSTFSFETFSLIEHRSLLISLMNMGGSVFLGQLGVMTGMLLARVL